MIAISCIIALPLLILPRKYFLSKLVYFLGWYFLRVTKLIYNINVEILGFENLKKYKNFIIASAHQSMFETFVFNYLVPDAFFVIKKELLFIPFYNLYLKKLIIFPHGTRVAADKEYPIKKGVYRIYQSLNIPCIPVYLNSGKFWPRNSFLKYPSKIKFVFKDPILQGLEINDFLDKLSKEIHY